MTNKLRLSYELGTIRDAVNGAMLLAESLRDRAFTRDEHAVEASACIAGILALSGERLKLVVMAVEEELDPGLLHALHNEADGEEDADGGIVLESRTTVHAVDEDPEPDGGKGSLVS
jgi:hypothetical protein